MHNNNQISTQLIQLALEQDMHASRAVHRRPWSDGLDAALARRPHRLLQLLQLGQHRGRARGQYGHGQLVLVGGEGQLHLRLQLLCHGCGGRRRRQDNHGRRLALPVAAVEHHLDAPEEEAAHVRERDVGVLGEEAVQEPGDGAEGEEEGEGEGHELGTLRPDHNEDDAQGGDEDGHGEGEADAAEHPDAVRLRDEHDGDDGDEREGGHVEEEEGGERPQPGAPRRVDEVEEDVGGLHHAPEGVDGQQRAGVGLHQRVQDPQRAAEQSHHIRHRAEPLRRLLPVHAEERRPACMHKFIHSFVHSYTWSADPYFISSAHSNF
uniref:Uncharacterized protein n=1 Tax=Zea mays TaxID=4577 RepID=C0PEY4_MAIZE|nr:unknown [Zea mays]